MSGPLIMPAGAPVFTVANGGVTSGADAAGAAGAARFENMLNTGLAGGAAAASGMAFPASPAALQAEATPKVQVSTAASKAESALASAAAHCVRGDPRKAGGDGGASDLLAALLAFAPGAGAMAPPAADVSTRDASVPADTNPHPETAAPALAEVMAQAALGRWKPDPHTVEPPAAERVSDGVGTLASSPAVPAPAQDANTADHDAGQPDGAVAVTSPGLTPRPWAAIAGDPDTVFARRLAGSTDAGSRTAEAAADILEELPVSLQQPSMGHGEPRHAAESADAARRRGGLQDPVLPDPGVRVMEFPPDGAEDRLIERTAGGTADPAARIGRMLRADTVPRLDAQSPVRERAKPDPYVLPGRDVSEDVRSAVSTTDRLTDRNVQRDAGRPPDPAAWIDAILRPDMAPRPDAPPPAAGRAGPVPVLHLDHNIGSAEWQREFGAQVSVLVSRREPQAEIRLNPPQLGPVEIRIGVQGDQVSLAFSAPQSETRAAIENALPQLREMFAGSGLELGNASVSAESSGRQTRRNAHPHVAPFPRDEPVAADAMPGIGRVAVRLVDTFA